MAGRGIRSDADEEYVQSADNPVPLACDIAYGLTKVLRANR